MRIQLAALRRATCHRFIHLSSVRSEHWWKPCSIPELSSNRGYPWSFWHVANVHGHRDEIHHHPAWCPLVHERPRELGILLVRMHAGFFFEMTHTWYKKYSQTKAVEKTKSRRIAAVYMQAIIRENCSVRIEWWNYMKNVWFAPNFGNAVYTVSYINLISSLRKLTLIIMELSLMFKEFSSSISFKGANEKFVNEFCANCVCFFFTEENIIVKLSESYFVLPIYII